MKERSVNQHQGWKTERNRRQRRRNFRRDEAQNNHKCVGDIKISPLGGQVEYIPRPALPVKGEFLNDVKPVCGKAEPNDGLKC